MNKCKLICIDPGPVKSGFVKLCGTTVLLSGVFYNVDILSAIKEFNGTGCVLVLEGLTCYGSKVGKSTFETAEWIGRFRQEFIGASTKVYRPDIVRHLCGSKYPEKTADAAVRRAIINMYPASGGGKIPQIGTKAKPGPLYGVTSHAWSALAVGLYYGR